jgi:putative acetyltransferase
MDVRPAWYPVGSWFGSGHCGFAVPESRRPVFCDIGLRIVSKVRLVWSPSGSGGALAAWAIMTEAEVIRQMRERLELLIREDDLTGAEIIALLRVHLRCMALVSPPESRHALDLAGLRKPGITFWSAWNRSDLAGCGAIKQLEQQHGEIKSMRTSYAYLRKGVASQMLQHIINEAKRRRYLRLSLETGSMDYFGPARKLYAGFGFTRSGPFGSYVEDPNSIFMSKEL